MEEDLLTEPEKFCPELSHNLNNAILRSMALQYELRFQSAEEFLKALFGETVIRNVGKELKTRKIRRFVSIVTVSAAALVGIFICLQVVDKRKKAAAILEPADISIWISADSAETVSEETAVMEEALEEFRTEYPQITVEIRCMANEEYETALRAAMEQGTLPTLFESACLSRQEFSGLEDMAAVFDFIDTGDYYFLDQYARYFPDEKQLPLAFVMPVVYYNTLANTEEKEVGELVEEGNFLVCEEGFLTWYNLYSGEEPVPDFAASDAVLSRREQIADKEVFLLNESACLIADTSVYRWIQRNMPGIYKVGFLKEAGMVGTFQDYFSISNTASTAEKEAAVQVLVYLLADTAQDVRYVQNGDYLPLNKKIYAAYVEINREFTDLHTGFSKMTMVGEYQALPNK